ncbi:MAG: MBL fold metallo-hydrolase [Candidatus Eisenbacteria bacterium]|nr:MBL fold metallo-hydrolase [Candidatus Eisenbacteria bacterium]
MFGDSGDQGIAPVSYTVTRLSSRVIVLDCLDVNVTAIATDSGLVVIDTNRSPGIMEFLRGVIEHEFGRADFAYVINTHGDPDHASGNRAFPSTPLIAHHDYAAFVLHAKASTVHNEWVLRCRLDEARRRCLAVDPGSPEEQELRARIAKLELLGADAADRQVPMVPTVTFADSLRMDLGDLTLELCFCGNAHTNHDIIVYVPEEKLLLVGDLINSPQIAGFSINAMADVPRLVHQLEGVLHRQSGLETVVPGHGATLSRADLSTFCRSVAERFGMLETENSAARLMEQTITTEGIAAALNRLLVTALSGQQTSYWSEEEFGTLGARLMRRGMVDEAVGVLRVAVDALPQSAFLHDCLGDACLEQDDTDAAAEAYEASLALMPQNRHAQEMLSILR